jgi:hypothetical protein
LQLTPTAELAELYFYSMILTQYEVSTGPVSIQIYLVHAVQRSPKRNSDQWAVTEAEATEFSIKAIPTKRAIGLTFSAGTAVYS